MMRLPVGTHSRTRAYKTPNTNIKMKYFACLVLLAILGYAAAGHIGSGWGSPSYGYAPTVYSSGWGNPGYGYGGYSSAGLYGAGWGHGFRGWNSGW